MGRKKVPRTALQLALSLNTIQALPDAQRILEAQLPKVLEKKPAYILPTTNTELAECARVQDAEDAPSSHDIPLLLARRTRREEREKWHERFWNILRSSKPRAERTVEEAETVFQHVKNLKGLRLFNVATLRQMCRVLALEEHSRYAVVFEQGAKPDCWYVVLKGKVDVVLLRDDLQKAREEQEALKAKVKQQFLARAHRKNSMFSITVKAINRLSQDSEMLEKAAHKARAARYDEHKGIWVKGGLWRFVARNLYRVLELKNDPVFMAQVVEPGSARNSRGSANLQDHVRKAKMKLRRITHGSLSQETMKTLVQVAQEAAGLPEASSVVPGSPAVPKGSPAPDAGAATAGSASAAAGGEDLGSSIAARRLKHLKRRNISGDARKDAGPAAEAAALRRKVMGDGKKLGSSPLAQPTSPPANKTFAGGVTMLRKGEWRPRVVAGTDEEVGTNPLANLGASSSQPVRELVIAPRARHTESPTSSGTDGSQNRIIIPTPREEAVPRPPAPPPAKHVPRYLRGTLSHPTTSDEPAPASFVATHTPAALAPHTPQARFARLLGARNATHAVHGKHFVAHHAPPQGIYPSMPIVHPSPPRHRRASHAHRSPRHVGAPPQADSGSQPSHPSSPTTLHSHVSEHQTSSNEDISPPGSPRRSSRGSEQLEAHLPGRRESNAGNLVYPNPHPERRPIGIPSVKGARVAVGEGGTHDMTAFVIPGLELEVASAPAGAPSERTSDRTSEGPTPRTVPNSEGHTPRTVPNSEHTTPRNAPASDDVTPRSERPAADHSRRSSVDHQRRSSVDHHRRPSTDHHRRSSVDHHRRSSVDNVRSGQTSTTGDESLCNISGSSLPAGLISSVTSPREPGGRKAAGGRRGAPPTALPDIAEEKAASPTATVRKGRRVKSNSFGSNMTRPVIEVGSTRPRAGTVHTGNSPDQNAGGQAQSPRRRAGTMSHVSGNSAPQPQREASPTSSHGHSPASSGKNRGTASTPKQRASAGGSSEAVVTPRSPTARHPHAAAAPAFEAASDRPRVSSHDGKSKLSLHRLSGGSNKSTPPLGLGNAAINVSLSNLTAHPPRYPMPQQLSMPPRIVSRPLTPDSDSTESDDLTRGSRASSMGHSDSGASLRNLLKRTDSRRRKVDFREVKEKTHEVLLALKKAIAEGQLEAPQQHKPGAVPPEATKERKARIPAKVARIYEVGEVLHTLERGVAFGELALKRNEPRSASIIAHPGCALLRVDGHDYFKIMKLQAKQELENKVAFLMSFDMFSMCTKEEVRKLADKMVFKEYRPGQRVCRNGERARHMHFIQRGEVTVERQVDMDDPDDRRVVHLGVLKRGSTFGEAVLKRGQRIQETVTAGPMGCVLGKLPRPEIIQFENTTFHNRLAARTSGTLFTKEELLRLYEIQIKETNWYQFRRDTLKSVLIEHEAERLLPRPVGLTPPTPRFPLAANGHPQPPVPPIPVVVSKETEAALVRHGASSHAPAKHPDPPLLAGLVY